MKAFVNLAEVARAHVVSFARGFRLPRKAVLGASYTAEAASYITTPLRTLSAVPYAVQFAAGAVAACTFHIMAETSSSRTSIRTA